MKPTPSNNAVIYARVSSAKQVEEGHGLSSQETRCREFAAHKGYQIVEVFRDEGVSGGLITRPGMQAMLKYLDENTTKSDPYVVIIDDISRLARDLGAHIQLRAEISHAGGLLESPSVEFGEDSDSILVENLLASVSQHQRQKNAEQVVHRMRARVMTGYWCFAPPVGYKYKTVKGHGKLLVQQKPVASLIKEVFEGLASGRFESATEVLQYLTNSPTFPRSKDGKVHFSRVIWMLENKIYAGQLDVPKWNLSLIQGKHEPIISFTIWKKAQHRLQSKGYAPIRKDINEDFPLRGFVCCGGCDHPMTAGWSTGRTQKYPYYLCANKGCPDYRKSIRRETMENEFEALLSELRPTRDLFAMAYDMLKEMWSNRLEASQISKSTLKKQLGQIDRKTAQFLDRIVDTDSPTIINAYETRIRTLEEDKVLLADKIAMCGRPVADFDETFRTAMEFLANPQKLWASGQLLNQRAAVKLTFPRHLRYVRNQGFRTAETSLPFKVLAGVSSGKKDMVGDTGIEPVTPTMSM